MKKGCQPRACSGVIKREGNKTNKRKRDESRISFVGSLSHYHKEMACLGSAPSSLVLQTSAFTRLAYKPSAEFPDMNSAGSFYRSNSQNLRVSLFVQNLFKEPPEQKSSVIKKLSEPLRNYLSYLAHTDNFFLIIPEVRLELTKPTF